MILASPENPIKGLDILSMEKGHKVPIFKMIMHNKNKKNFCNSAPKCLINWCGKSTQLYDIVYFIYRAI